jgi:hypothetical protein
VVLVAADGRNITTSFFPTTSAGFTAVSTGIGAAGVTSGGYTLSSSTGAPVVIGSTSNGTVANAGLAAGTYTANVSIVSSTARAAAATTVAFDGIVLNGNLYLIWNGSGTNGIKGVYVNSQLTFSSLKTIDASQVLFMANTFYINPVIVDGNSNFALEIGNKILNGAFIPINILDRLRVFSLGFSLVIGLILLYINGRFTAFNKGLDSIFSRYIVINLTIWLMLTLLFISNPGRYPLPYLLLSYIYLITALDKKYQKNNK